MPKSSTRYFVLSDRVDQLAPPRAGIPLAHRCRRALRGIFAKTTHLVASKSRRAKTPSGTGNLSW
eukprot:8246680-Pyramimonas_sp.AAC.1